MNAGALEVGGLVVLRIGDRSFALPVVRVRQILRMVAVTPVPDRPDWVLGVVNLRGSHIALIDLRSRLGLGNSSPDANSRIIVVETRVHAAGLVVDDVVDVVTREPDAVESFEELEGGEHAELTVARLGTATVVVLDVDEIVSGAHELRVPDDLDGYH